jgi:excisionase family DNA binding protein
VNRKYFTTSQAAQLFEVSPDTVLKGKIASYRTPGGHARIPRRAVETLLPTPPPTATPSLAEPPPYHFCWEFHGRGGVVDKGCLDCVVYRSRARRCYEMRDIPEQFGLLKLHCANACENCSYYHIVHGQGTLVLIVTRNQRLVEQIRAESEGGDVSLRFASGEYECSAVLDQFRPDFVVLDCSLGASRVQELCRHLAGDVRIPFTKIILTSGSESVKDCYEGQIFGWIKKPFTFLQLRCCLGQAE